MNSGAPDFDLEYKETVTAESNPNQVDVGQTADGSPEPEDPKYRGKSKLDIITMHRNAERKISEQGNQLGELRAQVDSILGLKKDNAKLPESKPKVTTEDLLNDPNAALERVIANSEVAQKLEKTSQQVNSLERGIGQADFESRYPNFMDDVNSQEFRDWVASNKARSSLLVELNNNYNFEAGMALWDMWEERRNLATPQQRKTNVDTRETIKQASTVKNSPSGEIRKPTYSRAKLLELQAKALKGDSSARARWNDPEFQREYHAAYAEGRVK